MLTEMLVRNVEEVLRLAGGVPVQDAFECEHAVVDVRVLAPELGEGDNHLPTFRCSLHIDALLIIGEVGLVVV